MMHQENQRHWYIPQSRVRYYICLFSIKYIFGQFLSPIKLPLQNHPYCWGHDTFVQQWAHYFIRAWNHMKITLCQCFFYLVMDWLLVESSTSVFLIFIFKHKHNFPSTLIYNERCWCNRSIEVIDNK